MELFTKAKIGYKVSYSGPDRDARVPQNDIYSDGLRTVEFNPTALKLIILIYYTLKDTQEGSVVMLQGEMKILSHPNVTMPFLMFV